MGTPTVRTAAHNALKSVVMRTTRTATATNVLTVKTAIVATTVTTTAALAADFLYPCPLFQARPPYSR